MIRLARIKNNKIEFSDSLNSIILNDRRIFNPSEEELRLAGFSDLPTVDLGENQHVEYKIENNEIIAVATDNEISKEIYQYSKLKIIIAAEKQGIVWSDVEDWMKENNLYAKWMAAQELANDYEGFDDVINLVKTRFAGYDIDAILEYAKK